MQTNIQAHNIAEIVNFALVEVEDGAKSSVPVVTGTTRDSINHFMTSEDFPIISGECFVGVPWAAALEFGYISRSGAHVAGKNFFTPNAIKGRATFNKMMHDYIKQVCVAVGPINVPTARKGGKGGHKYQFVEITSTGQKRYHYATKGQTRTGFKFVSNRSIYKTPSTRGRRFRGGSGGRRR